MFEKDVAVSLEIADLAPTGDRLTDYDREHASLYIRMLDADEAQAPWQDVARRLLRVDPEKDRDRARLRFETHLVRARWVRDVGYAQLARAQPH